MRVEESIFPRRLPGGAVGMMAPLTARIVRRNFRADLARLKGILEAEAGVARWVAPASGRGGGVPGPGIS
jgi:hypothetical protein